MKIAADRSFKFCPNSRCSSLLKINQSRIGFKQEERTHRSIKIHPENIICPNCNNNFCVECDKPAHWPASCEDAEWFIKESEKLLIEMKEPSFYVARVKKCPQCRLPMEKNAGCQHMTCRCSHQFCWECLKDWAEHVNSTNSWKCNTDEGKVPVEVFHQFFTI